MVELVEIVILGELVALVEIAALGDLVEMEAKIVHNFDLIITFLEKLTIFNMNLRKSMENW